MEKNAWMYLFFFLLLVCAVLAFFLAQGSNEPSFQKKYEALKEQNDRQKQHYDELKKSYIELARWQSTLLEQMMTDHRALRKFSPSYSDLTDAELERRVRKDIGLLEVKAEELEKFGALETKGEKPKKVEAAEEANK